MNSSFEPQFDSQADDSAMFRQELLGATARAGVLNRTRRVVRQRARFMQARRSHVRSLLLPLMICSALLILCATAVWSGLYQYQAAEVDGVVQADVAALAATEATNHLLVALLWFVPVSAALIIAAWVRRSRKNAGGGAL